MDVRCPCASLQDVQTAYVMAVLTLHSLTLLMKIHSYCATNGVLSEKALELKKLRKQLDTLLDALPEGRKGALREARQELDAPNTPTSPQSMTSALSGTSGSTLGPDDTKLSRRRSSATELVAQEKEDLMKSNHILDVLYFHPDTKIAELASSSLDLLDDLTSRGKEKVVWPNNLSLWNFLDYLRLPTLVYELEYPRTTTYVPLSSQSSCQY